MSSMSHGWAGHAHSFWCCGQPGQAPPTSSGGVGTTVRIDLPEKMMWYDQNYSFSQTFPICLRFVLFTSYPSHCYSIEPDWLGRCVPSSKLKLLVDPQPRFGGPDPRFGAPDPGIGGSDPGLGATNIKLINTTGNKYHRNQNNMMYLIIIGFI